MNAPLGTDSHPLAPWNTPDYIMEDEIHLCEYCKDAEVSKEGNFCDSECEQYYNEL